MELAAGGTRSHQWEEETHFYFEKGWVKLFTPSPLNRQARGVSARMSMGVLPGGSGGRRTSSAMDTPDS